MTIQNKVKLEQKYNFAFIKFIKYVNDGKQKYIIVM